MYLVFGHKSNRMNWLAESLEFFSKSGAGTAREMAVLSKGVTLETYGIWWRLANCPGRSRTMAT
jgi:hypothetical protein